MATRPRRSCLTVPASSRRMLAKAATLPADELVLDLEDGVAPELKTDATRAQLVEAVGSGARGTVAVRINGLGTPWWRDDLAAAAEARPDVVVIPKVESPDDVALVAGLLPPTTGIEAQIETARGLVEVERIAAAGHGLEALVFGPGDFGASIGVPVLTIGEGSWDYALARIVVAARAFGLQAVDGPYAAIGDLDGLRASARRALAHGLDGKWIVHPDQIATVNDVFTPAPEELERARRILAAGEGAVLVDGEMVDRASRRLAEALVARAHAADA
jgi:citrate lyase subunit beta/citryl-CoA lyase